MAGILRFPSEQNLQTNLHLYNISVDKPIYFVQKLKFRWNAQQLSHVSQTTKKEQFDRYPQKSVISTDNSYSHDRDDSVLDYLLWTFQLHLLTRTSVCSCSFQVKYQVHAYTLTKQFIILNSDLLRLSLGQDEFFSVHLSSFFYHKKYVGGMCKC